LFRYRNASGNEKPGLQVERQDVVLPVWNVQADAVPPSLQLFLKMALRRAPVHTGGRRSAFFCSGF